MTGDPLEQRAASGDPQAKYDLAVRYQANAEALLAEFSTPESTLGYAPEQLMSYATANHALAERFRADARRLLEEAAAAGHAEARALLQRV